MTTEREWAISELDRAKEDHANLSRQLRLAHLRVVDLTLKVERLAVAEQVTA